MDTFENYLWATHNYAALVGYYFIKFNVASESDPYSSAATSLIGNSINEAQAQSRTAVSETAELSGKLTGDKNLRLGLPLKNGDTNSLGDVAAVGMKGNEELDILDLAKKVPMNSTAVEIPMIPNSAEAETATEEDSQYVLDLSLRSRSENCPVESEQQQGIDKGRILHCFNKKKDLSYCSICFRSFSRPSSIRRHMDTHASDLKTFECDQNKCGQHFMSLDNFLHHVVCHVGERPYAFYCPWCCYTACQKATIDDHVLKIHGHHSVPTGPKRKSFGERGPRSKFAKIKSQPKKSKFSAKRN